MSSDVAATRADAPGPAPSRASDTTRRWRHGLLILLYLLLLARAPFAATTMDFARDVFTGLRILQGDARPLSGPVFGGGLFHLGPVWNYFVAALLALSRHSWSALVWMIAALAALQVPLAYLAGKALRGRAVGVLWACLLCIPSWGVLQSMLVSHPTLLATLLLAFVLMCIRQWQAPSTRHLVGMGITFVLMLHAHPSGLVVGWLWIPVVVRTWRLGALRAGAVVATVAIAALPLVPLLLWDASQGFRDVGAAGGYVAAIEPLRALSAVPSLLRAVAFGGHAYVFGDLLRWPTAATAIALGVCCLVIVAALAGAIRARATPRRASLAAAAATVVVVALLTALLRDITPFYMVTPLEVVFAGLLALALAPDREMAGSKAMHAAVAAFAVLTTIACDVGLAHVQERGRWPFAWLPVMDVKQAPEPAAPLMLVSARAMVRSGRFLCAAERPSIHGAYANHLLLDYAIEMRLRCGTRDLLLGGSDAAREHWLGLSRAMFSWLGIEPERRLGPIGLVHARPLAVGRAIAIQDAPQYPAYTPRVTAMEERRLAVEIGAGQRIAVADLAHMMAGSFDADATIGGRPLAPLARDGVVAVYACPACRNADTVTVDLVLRGDHLDDADVVVF